MRTVELVKWLDPHTEMDWAVGDNSARPTECWSVGLVVSEHETYMVLAGDWSDDETNTRMVIPRGCILSRTVIHKGEDE